MRILAVAAFAIAFALAPPAYAQPGYDTAAALHDANGAASTGDWAKVDAIVSPLFMRPLARADLAEAHRLAGLAAFFTERKAAAESHWFAYLKLDLDARLDPSLVPPEAVTFFEEVRARHAAELRALRPPAKGSVWLNVLPAAGQFQNGQRAKGWVIGSLFVAFAATNVTTYFVLRSWCASDDTCDSDGNHTHSARTLRTLNLVSGVGLIATYVYGVYDGVTTYHARSREQFVPYASSVDGGGVVGVAGAF